MRLRVGNNIKEQGEVEFREDGIKETVLITINVDIIVVGVEEADNTEIVHV